MSSTRPAGPPPAPPGSVSLSEAAVLLGVHYMTAYRYVRTGRLPAIKRGGTWEVERADVERIARGPARPARGAARRADAAGRFERRLVAGDEAGAWTLIEEARVGGASPVEVYRDLLEPALRSIGHQWEDGTLTVADEHRASGVAMRLVGRMGPSFARRGRAKGEVLVGAPVGERHSLPIAIAGDLLRERGFVVTDLGADVPPESFAEAAAAADRLVAVAICVTVATSRRAVRAAAAAVRAAVDGAPILVGGAAVADLDDALRLGADGWSGHDGDALVQAVEALAAR